MSDEHDSWLNDAFGLDLRQSLGKIKDDAVAAIDSATSTVTQAAQEVQGAVEGAIAGVAGAAAGAAKKIAGAVAPSGASGAGQGGAGGGSGSFPLRGSVGRGGKNAASDVRAVQAALGIGVDGQCGGQTIAAIEAFQRNMGMAKADGRVDAGGGTERALAGGARPSPGSTPAGGDAGSLLDQLPGNAALPLATNAGILETAEAALIAAGEVTGVSPAARQVGAVASQAGSIVADDPLSAGAGLGFGAVQGLAPGGFLVPSPKPESKAFELGRGVGMIGGGIAAVAIGGGEEVIGTGLDATGVGAIVGVPINILGAVTIASGVTSAGVGVATVGGVLSTGGGGGEGPPTVRDPPKPPPEPAVPKTNVPLTPAQAEQNLAEAIAEQKAAEKAASETNTELIRFRANKPFDPVVAEALEDQAQRASDANVEAIRRVQAAERAVRDANARAKGASGGGGFPPPRR